MDEEVKPLTWVYLKTMGSVAFLILAGFILFGCGGGGSGTNTTTPSSSTEITSQTERGTINGVISLPSNTSAKLFLNPVRLFVKLIASPAYAGVISDMTQLIVTAGDTSTKPDSMGKYVLSVMPSVNLYVTVIAPSGNLVLEAVVPSVTEGSTTTQDIDAASTAVARVYKTYPYFTIPQIQNATSVIDALKKTIESSLVDTREVSIEKDVVVMSDVASAVSTIASYPLPPEAEGIPGDGKAMISWTPIYRADTYNLYVASQSGVTKTNYASLPDGNKFTNVTSPKIISGLTNGKTYYFALTGANTTGESLVSEEMSITPPGGALRVQEIALGDSHTCAVRTDGTVKCWGDNSFGQIGESGGNFSVIPVPVSGISNPVSLAAGDLFTCAVLSTGSVQCWGVGKDLGNGTQTSSAVPQTVLDINNAVSVTAGQYHACALLSDGAVKCWGENRNGQLGIGVTKGPESCGSVPTSGKNREQVYCSTKPVSVVGITTAVSLSADEYSTCALLSDKTVKCWGNNSSGVLGIGNASGPESCGDSGSPCSSKPLTVTNLENVKKISSTCALLSDGTIKCWGYNHSGQLGVGTHSGPETCGENSCSTLPVTVKDVSGALDISSGGGWGFACALLNDRNIKCWGNNTRGELGDGPEVGPETCFYYLGRPMYCSTSPVPVYGISDAAKIVAGGSHACVILKEGTLRCWGKDDVGQLGNNGNYDKTMNLGISGEGCSEGWTCSTTPVTVWWTLYSSP